jgi:dihydrolipoamide dehydrogenase
MKEYEVVVIGGGPGGYAGAIRASQLGGAACVVEQDELGGTCTNRGCIPTKALAASAHLFERVRHAADMGVVVSGEPKLDFGRVAERRDGIVGTLRDGIAGLLKAHKVDLVRGKGVLNEGGSVVVEGAERRELKAKNVIVATGSVPAGLPFLPLDGHRVVSSDEILAMSELPRRMAVIGGGVIGCEFASIYRTFGVEVTVIELLDRLIPTMDPAQSNVLRRAFRRAGIGVLTATAVEGVETKDQEVEVLLPGGERLAVDLVLVSVGRRSATADMGLEEAGVGLERGCVRTDEHMATSADGVYAIGDAVGKTWLAHTATREAELAAANAMGHAERMRYDAVPGVVFTVPEIAAVGMGPADAAEQKLDVQVGKFLYNASSKALCDGVADGRVEIITETGSERILGGWVAGYEAGILISEITVAVNEGMTARQLIEVIHSHPTLPEMVAEAAGDSLGLAIHRAPPRRR